MAQPEAELNVDGLATLLRRLDPDPVRAAQAYAGLRRTLAAFFEWRGAASPEECVDISLDRLAAKLDQGQAIDDVRRFARGIARLVLLESYRRPEARIQRADEAELLRLPARPASEEQPERECLERCLDALPAESRELILRYYVDRGRSKIENRRKLAAELGTSEAGLRSRAQRVRDRLEACMSRCLAGEGDTEW